MKDGDEQAFDGIDDPSSGEIDADLAASLPFLDGMVPMRHRRLDAGHEGDVALEGVLGDEEPELRGQGDTLLEDGLDGGAPNQSAFVNRCTDLFDLTDCPVADGQDQLVAAGKAAMQGGTRDPRSLRDLLQGCARIRGEGGDGGVQQIVVESLAHRFPP